MRKKKSHERPQKEELDSDERELFFNAFYQGLDLEEKPPPPIEKSHALVPSFEQPDLGERELFLQAVEQGASPHYFDKEPQRLSQKRLAKKRNTIAASIDLHGMFAEDAINVLLKFIERSQKRGHRTILVVHGKGGGVLKNAVYALLESHSAIATFQSAPAKLGGAGALVIRLRLKSHHR